MIISRTPFRISFFGGGTDYPAWFKTHGGAVLSTSINKYCYISCRYLPPFFEHKHRIIYSHIENVKNLDEIRHPAVKAIFKYFNVKEGVELHHDADLPARSGIGSSSSFTVGLLNAMFASRGQMKSKKELAELAIHMEQNVIKETVGSQDQIAAAFGGFNRVDFNHDGGFSVRPFILPESRFAELNGQLMMFFTGFSRIASEIAQSQVANFDKRENTLRRMQEMVDEAEKVLNSSGSLELFGRMLHESWKLKRELSGKVSTTAIDEIYETAIRAGALGGKILGAGGGGFILFFVPFERQQSVRNALSSLVEVGFRFENRGSHIVFYDPALGNSQELGGV